MERPLKILFIDEHGSQRDLLAHLRRNYAVHTPLDPARLLQQVEQAGADGQAYDLAVLIYPEVQLGDLQTVRRLRVIAPATSLVAVVDSPAAGEALGGAGVQRFLVGQPDPAAVQGVIDDLLAERRAAFARSRSEVLRPLVELGSALLRQPNLDRALRRLCQELVGLIPAEYLYVVLVDRRRDQLIFPLLYDHGEYRAAYTRPAAAGLGLADWVLGHDAPVISGNFPAHAPGRGWPQGDPDLPFLPLSVMALPLHLGGAVIGAVSAGSTRADAYQADEIALFGFVADLLAGVVAQWWTALQWERQTDLLAQFDHTLAAGGDPAQILTATAAAARRLTGMAAATVVGRLGADAPYTQFPALEGAPTTPFAGDLTGLTAQLAAARPGGEPVDHTQVTDVLTHLGTRGVGRIISHRLTVAGSVDAMLWLLHPTERPFDAQDKAGLAAVVGHGRQALTLATVAAARQQERDAFARIAWRATAETNLSLLLSSALMEIRTLVPWVAAAVWQEDRPLPGLYCLWSEGSLTAVEGAVLPPDSPFYAAANVPRRVLPLAGPAAEDPAFGLPHGPAVAVSLRYSELQVPGLLVLERAPDAAPFSADETALLLQLGQVLTPGIEKLRWHALAALHRDLAEALAAAPPDVWPRVGAALSAELPPGAVGVLVPEGARWRPLVVTQLGRPDVPPAWYETAAAALGSSGPAAVYGPAQLARYGVAGLGTLALAPIVVGDVRLGVVAFWTSRAAAARGTDLELLSHAATHLAPLLWAGPPAGAARAPGPLLDVLRALQDAAVTAQSMPRLLQSILLHLLSSTPATAGAVLLRTAGDRLVLGADYPATARVSLSQAAFNAATQVAARGQPAYLAGPEGSVACVPLPASSPPGLDTAALGVLVLGSPHPDAFSPADRDLLGQLAPPVAALLAERAVQDAERALHSALGLPVTRAQILARTPELICRAFHVPVCLIHVLDRRENRFVVQGWAGLSAAPGLQALALAGDDPALRAFFQAAPEQLGAADGPGSRLWPAPLLAAAGLRFGLVVPFWVDGRAYGLISLHTFADRPPVTRAPDALATVAAALGALLESLQQERRLDALAALSRSPLQAEAAPFLPATIIADGAVGVHLTRLLESALQLVEADAVYLLLGDGTSSGLRVHTSAGAAQPVRDIVLPALRHLRTLTSPYYLSDVQRTRPADYPVFNPATRSSLLLPLRVGDDPATPSAVLGVIVVESSTPFAVSQEDYRVLLAVAALTTALLAQQGLLQQLHGVTAQVHGALDATTPLWDETDDSQLHQQLVAGMRTALGADLAVLYPWDGRQPLPLVPPQSGNRHAGVLASDPQMQALVRRVVAAPRPAQPLVVDVLPAPSSPAVPEWVVLEEVRSLMVVPLISGGAVLGALLVAYRRPMRFDQPFREVVSLFATLAATMLKNQQTRTTLAATVQGQLQSLSLAAHELRDPVDKVHMIIETALNGLWLPMSDTLRERLSVAYKLLDDHYESLGRVLQLGRLQAGTEELIRRATAPLDLVQAVIGRHAEFARAQGVVLQAEVDPLLSLQRPLLDEALLRVALGNLVHNAVKYSQAGDVVTLRCSTGYSGDQREFICAVEDQGAGVPAELQEQIFAPYYQGDHTLSRQEGGFGLGLALARMIVNLHGGTLAIESAPGNGSRFTAQIPFLVA